MDPFNHYTSSQHHQKEMEEGLTNLTISVTPRVNIVRRSRPKSAYDSNNTKACFMMTPSPTVLHQTLDTSPHESLCSSGVCSDLTKGSEDSGNGVSQSDSRVGRLGLHHNDIESRSDVRDFASGDLFVSPTLVHSHHHRQQTPNRKRHPELTPVMPRERQFTLNLCQSERLPRDTSMTSMKRGLVSAVTTPTCPTAPSTGPRRSVSMTRLYQLAQPRKRYLEETIKWREEHLGNRNVNNTNNNAMTQSLMVTPATDRVHDDPMIRSCNDLLPSSTSKPPPTVSLSSHKKKTPRRPRPVSMNLTPVSEFQRDPSATQGRERQQKAPIPSAKREVQSTSKTPSKGATKAPAGKTPRVTMTQATSHAKDDAENAEFIKKKEEEFKRKREEKRREEEARRRQEIERLRIEAEEEEKRQRLEQERLQKEEEERIRQEEEEACRLEEEQRKLADQLKKAEEEKLRKAIEEQQRKQEEERKRVEEENRLRLEREEQEQKAREEAERARIEREEKLKKDEEERLARKKKLEDIMSRTRSGKTPGGPKSSNQTDEIDCKVAIDDQHNQPATEELQVTQVVPLQASPDAISITSTDSNGNTTTTNGGSTINTFPAGEVAF